MPGGSDFSAPVGTGCFLGGYLFYWSHPEGGKVVPHCGFRLLFSNYLSDMDHLFLSLLAMCKPSSEKCLVESLTRYLIRSAGYAIHVDILLSSTRRQGLFRGSLSCSVGVFVWLYADPTAVVKAAAS